MLGYRCRLGGVPTLADSGRWLARRGRDCAIAVAPGDRWRRGATHRRLRAAKWDENHSIRRSWLANATQRLGPAAIWVSRGHSTDQFVWRVLCVRRRMVSSSSPVPSNSRSARGLVRTAAASSRPSDVGADRIKKFMSECLKKADARSGGAGQRHALPSCQPFRLILVSPATSLRRSRRLFAVWRHVLEFQLQRPGRAVRPMRNKRIVPYHRLSWPFVTAWIVFVRRWLKWKRTACGGHGHDNTPAGQ